jgi:hypothetical protein
LTEQPEFASVRLKSPREMQLLVSVLLVQSREPLALATELLEPSWEPPVLASVPPVLESELLLLLLEQWLPGPVLPMERLLL